MITRTNKDTFLLAYQALRRARVLRGQKNHGKAMAEVFVAVFILFWGLALIRVPALILVVERIGRLIQ